MKLGTGLRKSIIIKKLTKIIGIKICLEALFWGAKWAFKDNC